MQINLEMKKIVENTKSKKSECHAKCNCGNVETADKGFKFGKTAKAMFSYRNRWDRFHLSSLSK